uniref:Uncharacterized protein n=1 Tax=viral metagenome TaxID=1070528 RepID=A0A6M3XKW6_9ZZZZ
MKTIGYRDLCDGSKRIREYVPRNMNTHLFNKQTRLERIKAGLNDLKHTGNIAVYLINNNKYQEIFRKGL